MTSLIRSSIRTQTSLSLNTGGAAAGENVFEIEINRSEDFVSDESIFLENLPIGSVTINNLPSGTTYFLRHRSTNLSQPGAWSNVVNMSTLPATPDGPYEGSSIGPSVVVIPEYTKIQSFNQSAIVAGSDPSALLMTDPNSVLAIRGDVDPAIIIETSGQPYDCVALLGCFCGPQFRVRYSFSNNIAGLNNASLQFETELHPSSSLGRKRSYHGVYFLNTPVNFQYIRINIISGTAPPQALMRNFIIGLQKKTQNYVRGSSEDGTDLGSIDRNILGSEFTVSGWRGRQASFGLEWLDETEYYSKWNDLDQRVGQTKPILAIPNSAPNQYIHDRILFGELTASTGEHTRARKYARNFEINSIY